MATELATPSSTSLKHRPKPSSNLGIFGHTCTEILYDSKSGTTQAHQVYMNHKHVKSKKKETWQVLQKVLPGRSAKRQRRSHGFFLRACENSSRWSSPSPSWRRRRKRAHVQVHLPKLTGCVLEPRSLMDCHHPMQISLSLSLLRWILPILMISTGSMGITSVSRCDSHHPLLARRTDPTDRSVPYQSIGRPAASAQTPPGSSV